MHTNPAAAARWSKSHPSWGKGPRVQRNYYAFLVTMTLTGGDMVCPCCGRPLVLTGAASQVDRVMPELDYCEGNVVLVCESCNQDRAQLQRVGADWQGIAAYAADVRAASASVTVPTQADARRWADGHGEATGPVSRYA